MEDFIIFIIVLILIFLQILGKVVSIIIKIILLCLSIYIIFVLIPNNTIISLLENLGIIWAGICAFISIMLTPLILMLEYAINGNDLEEIEQSAKIYGGITLMMCCVFVLVGSFILEPGSYIAINFFIWALECLFSAVIILSLARIETNYGIIGCATIAILFSIFFVPMLLLAQILALQFSLFGGILSLSMSLTNGY